LLRASDRIIAKAEEKNRGIFLNQMILKEIKKVERIYVGIRIVSTEG